MALQTTDTNTAISQKSGKGISDGVVSEMTAFFTVRPGHEQQLREACARFSAALRDTDPLDTQKTGLRDSRHVIFDSGSRLIWTTTFETDWDPYLDDALLLVGVEHFIDWMQHTGEAERLGAWLRQAGGREQLGSTDVAAREQTVKATSAGLKQILQSVQTPAAGYFNLLSDQTMPELRKAVAVEQAFQQVLDNPTAEDALTHPALALLLEQAAS